MRSVLPRSKWPQVVAVRETLDEKTVAHLSDGAIVCCGRLLAYPGEPMRVGTLVIGEVEIFDSGELRGLVAAARASVSRDGTPGTLRKHLDKCFTLYRPKPLLSLG